MKLNWKKLVVDLIKVLAGALAGATVAGCASVPMFIF